MLYRFEQYELDVDRHEFRADGELRVLEPQVFDILRHLIENHNRLVSREELMEVIWKGRIVSESTVDTRIHAARRAVDDDGGRQVRIKTVPRRGYRITAEVEVVHGEGGLGPGNYAGGPNLSIALTDKPSVAVLPFDNLSDDPGQEYFADGITDDLITVLSKFRSVFVIARHSSFTYKDRTFKVQDVGNDLGVQYVVEGGVRRANNRVRITAQLIDAANGHHIWAERYDRELGEIFVVQDDITQRIVMAVAPELYSTEMARAQRKTIPELGVWELLARANWHVCRFTEKDIGEAEELLYKALEINPDYARIHAALSGCYMTDCLYGWRRPQPRSRALSLEMGERAVDLDKEDELSHTQFGISLYMSKRHEEAAQRLRTAIKLNPNYSQALGGLGLVLVYTHEHDEALELLHKAMQLSPKDPMLPFYTVNIGMLHFMQERYEEALVWGERAAHENPNNPTGYRLLSAANGMLGNLAEARAAYEKFDRFVPGVTIAATLEVAPLTYEGDAERFAEGLRRAGMPEE